jgi:hypothetical protein
LNLDENDGNRWKSGMVKDGQIGEVPRLLGEFEIICAITGGF